MTEAWCLDLVLCPVSDPVDRPLLCFQSPHSSKPLLPLTSVHSSLCLWKQKPLGNYLTLICLNIGFSLERYRKGSSSLQRKLCISLATICKSLLLYPAICCPVLTVLPRKQEELKPNEIPILHPWPPVESCREFESIDILEGSRKTDF